MAASMHTVFIGLGSNLDDPVAQLQQAWATLKAAPWCREAKISSLYRSVAVGPPQPDYINAVAQVTTDLAPLDLLDALQAIELNQGRQRLIHWGPRTLDLDILLIDQEIIQHERLQVPHPYLTERNFVLIPLAELAPELRLPDGRNIGDLAAQIGNEGLTRLA